MKYSIGFLALILILSNRSVAQDKLLSLEDCVTNFDLYPETLSHLQWRGSTGFYTYVSKDNLSLIQGSSSGKEEIILTCRDLNGKFPQGVDTLKRIPAIQWYADDEFGFRYKGALWAYNLSSGKLVKKNSIPSDANEVDIASNYNTAFTKDFNLYVAYAAIDKTVQATKDGSYELVYGEAAHRFEFGIGKGIFWSPAGDKVAFYRVDQSMVSDYPLIDYGSIPAKEKKVKYPFAGDSSHQASIGVFDLRTAEVMYLKTGDPYDQYLTNITWSPDGNRIYVAIVNRGQDTMKLNVYHANTGAFIKTLFTETDKEYVEPEHGPFFLPDNKSFIWQSERDGFNHLYLYTIDGKLQGQLTNGEWEVTEFLGVDKEGKVAIFTSTGNGPLERHHYSVDLRNRKLQKITSERGRHRGKLSADGRYLIDDYSNTDLPRQIEIVNCRNGKSIKTLLNSSNPLAGYNLGELSLFSIKAADGTDLYCRMIKPIDFNPAAKYPVFVYLYGGPHLQLIHNAWNGNAQLFLHYMAQQGFLVFSLDNRGSSGRGLDFEQAIFQNMGTLELEDQMEGVRYLRSLPFVDSTRMAVYGWSYGGFMSSSLMLRKPGTFKVGVAGGPVTDWQLYEVMYGERYMNTPQENPEGYAVSRLMNHIENLDGKLLIIHGLLDDTVVPQHSRALLMASVERGKLLDYYAYPDHPHNVRGKDRVHLLNKVATYVIENLK